MIIKSSIVQPSYYWTLEINFSALVLAERIFCFSLKLSSSSSFKLCSLSARSIDKLSLYFKSFSKICPHSAPSVHFSFIWIFYSFKAASLYLILFLCSTSIHIPWLNWSYLSSTWVFWCCLTLVLQISIPCLNPIFKLLEKVESAILTPSSFFSAY